MLKNVLPKVLFVAAIVGIIAAGNYFFKEEATTTPVATAQAEPQEQSDEQSE